LRIGIFLGACFDPFDHVALSLIDQLIGQTFEAIGQRSSLGGLQVSRLRGTTGADQLHSARDDCDELVIVLTEPAQQLNFVLGHELQTIDVVSELVELAQCARQRPLVRRQKRGGDAVKLSRRVMLDQPIGFDLALQLDQFLGALMDGV
jgi:hypothetical protein